MLGPLDGLDLPAPLRDSPRGGDGAGLDARARPRRREQRRWEEMSPTDRIYHVFISNHPWLPAFGPEEPYLDRPTCN